MKNNRHNRKLKFIRTKNHLRKGDVMKAVMRVSNDFLLSDPDLVELEIKDTEAELSKRYKLNLKCIGNIIGTQGDDLVFDCSSILMSFRCG